MQSLELDSFCLSIGTNASVQKDCLGTRVGSHSFEAPGLTKYVKNLAFKGEPGMPVGWLYGHGYCRTFSFTC